MEPRIFVHNLSPEIEQTVYKYSNVTHYRFGLIDDQPFTVNPRQYPDSQVLLVRDTYCVSKKLTLDQVFAKIRADAHSEASPILNISIKGLHPQTLAFQKTYEAAKYATLLNSSTRLEIGSGEESNIFQLRPLLDRYSSFPLVGCVIDTGSLVRDFNQVRAWNRMATIRSCEMLKDAGLYARELQSDYLTVPDIQSRKGILTGITIGPELAIAQAEIVLNLFQRYNISTTTLRKFVLAQKVWKNLIHLYGKDDVDICFLLSLPYFLNSKQYRDCYKQLVQIIDPAPLIEQKLIFLLDKYSVNYF